MEPPSPVWRSELTPPAFLERSAGVFPQIAVHADWKLDNLGLMRNGRREKGERTMATCDECGFDWDASLLEMIRIIERFPDRASVLLDGAGDVVYRRPAPETWSPNEYMWHVLDTYHIFAEWLHMTRTEDHPTHASANADQLAEVRGYAERPIETALWALRPAAGLLVEEATIVDPDRLVMYKDWRDVTAAEVIGFAAHEAAHHLIDLERAVTVPAAG